MLNRSTTLLLGTVLTLGGFAAGCGDDTTTGPMFGDLDFTPSFENIGSERSTALSLTNTSSSAQGPIFVGLDVVFETTMPDSLCSSIGVAVTPAQITSLDPNESATIDVSIDTQDVDLLDCPPAQYDADIFASVDNRVLGGATVRFDWSGTPP